jgi:hypothetical protein
MATRAIATNIPDFMRISAILARVALGAPSTSGLRALNNI